MFRHSKILLFVLALIATRALGDVVITNTGIPVHYPGWNALGNCPVRVIRDGGTGDTAWDKIVFTDSLGIFAAKFNIAAGSAAGFWIRVGEGTQFQSSASITDPFLEIHITVPQDQNHDTVDISNDNQYQNGSSDPSVNNTHDSISISGSVTDKTNPGNNVPNAHVTLEYRNFAKVKDSLVNTTASNITGMFSFPIYHNVDLITRGILYVSAPGYLTDTVPFLVPDTATNRPWNGKLHALDTTILLTPGVSPPDTIDTLLIRGTVKDSALSQVLAKAYISVLLDTTSSDQTAFNIPALHDSTKTDGTYSIKYPNIRKSAKVYYKVQASANNYKSSDTLKSSVTIASPHDGKNDTCNVDTIKLAVRTITPGPDSIIVAGTVQDSAQTKVLAGAAVLVTYGPDTNTANYKDTLTTANANGKYWVKIPESNSSRVYFLVSSYIVGYKLNSVKKDTLLTAGDGINDSIKINFKLGGNSTGDTLFVKGVVDSALQNHPLQGATVKIFFQLSLDSLKKNPLKVDSAITDANGGYLYKFVNSYNGAFVLNKVYYQIQVTKLRYKDTSYVDSAFFIPNDWISDTIAVKQLATTNTIHGNIAFGLPVVRTPVSIYNLNGRLIKSFIYESTGSIAGIPKFLKSIGIRQKAYIMEINGKNGVVRKQIINLK
jgi:hypothetical protein